MGAKRKVGGGAGEQTFMNECGVCVCIHTHIYARTHALTHSFTQTHRTYTFSPVYF